MSMLFLYCKLAPTQYLSLTLERTMHTHQWLTPIIAVFDFDTNSMPLKRRWIIVYWYSSLQMLQHLHIIIILEIYKLN